MTVKSASVEALFKPLRDNWVVLAALVGLGVAWGTTSSTVSANEKTVEEQRKVIETQETRIKKVEEAVVEFKVTNEFTQRDIAEIKEMLRRALEQR